MLTRHLERAETLDDLKNHTKIKLFGNLLRSHYEALRISKPSVTVLKLLGLKNETLGLEEYDVSVLKNDVIDGTFSRFQFLNTVILPKNLIKIGYFAFMECVRLNTVVLPDTVIEINDRAFESCVNLTTINFPLGLQTIGKYAFYNCEKLSKIDLPISLKFIGECAFGGCNAIEADTISLPLTAELGALAFPKKIMIEITSRGTGQSEVVNCCCGYTYLKSNPGKHAPIYNCKSCNNAIRECSIEQHSKLMVCSKCDREFVICCAKTHQCTEIKCPNKEKGCSFSMSINDPGKLMDFQDIMKFHMRYVCKYTKHYLIRCPKFPVCKMEFHVFDEFLSHISKCGIEIPIDNNNDKV